MGLSNIKNGLVQFGPKIVIALSVTMDRGPAQRESLTPSSSSVDIISREENLILKVKANLAGERVYSNSFVLWENGDQGDWFCSCEVGKTSNRSWKWNSSSAAKDGVLRGFILQISGIDQCKVPSKCPKSRWAIYFLHFIWERNGCETCYCGHLRHCNRY